MAEINDLSVTDASNTGRWPENMPFGDVNNAGRADEGLLARWYKDTDSSITASGSSNAFTITCNSTIAAYFNNLVMAFTANHSITGATTLNMNGIGAKTVKRFNGDNAGVWRYHHGPADHRRLQVGVGPVVHDDGAGGADGQHVRRPE